MAAARFFAELTRVSQRAFCQAPPAYSHIAEPLALAGYMSLLSNFQLNPQAERAAKVLANSAMANQQSFRNFEDRLRLQANAVDEGKKWSLDGTNLANLRGFSNLSLSEHARSKAERPNGRRNFGNEKLPAKGKLKQKNGNLEWKQGEAINGHTKTGLLPGIYNNNTANQTNNTSNSTGTASNTNGGSSNSNNNNNNNNNNALDKRFKTLPPAESLPRHEMLGGYIFVCNNDTMQDDLKRLLFGLPQRYRDSVRAITPGLPLFLYNYTTHQLHGIFEAASFGGTNIDPTAWEDKKCRGESRFPAQVRIRMRKFCKPLEEDAFRPVLHHYDGPKFRLQLNIPETLSLLDIFAANGAL